jgi:hypothetical protein
MNAKLLAMVILALCGVLIASAAAQQSSTGKKPPVVRQQPLGEYVRCDENCPPPGISATPSEIWCANRLQCTSLSGCGCRLLYAQERNHGLCIRGGSRCARAAGGRCRLCVLVREKERGIVCPTIARGISPASFTFRMISSSSLRGRTCHTGCA